MDVNKKGYYVDWREPDHNERHVVVKISWVLPVEFRFTTEMTKDQMVLAILGSELFSVSVGNRPQGEKGEAVTTSIEAREVALGGLSNQLDTMLSGVCEIMDNEEREAATESTVGEF